MKNIAFCLLLGMFSVPALAEEAGYGEVQLNGLSRDNNWPYNNQAASLSMVCNVNGPDGFLTIRTGPGTGYPSARKLNRLAIVVVAPKSRQGRWIRVDDAYRTVTKDGRSQNFKPLPVQGWAHDGYLCDFIH